MMHRQLIPEELLVVAVIEQAIRDLSDPDPTIRKEANHFFFGGGGWQEQRDFYCGAVGVDPEVLQEQIRRSDKTVTRPSDQSRLQFTQDHLRALIPVETAFRPMDLAWPHGVSEVVKQTRLKALRESGYIEQIGNGHYALTSLNHPRMLSQREVILSLLEDDPLTTDQIARRTRPRIKKDQVYAYCFDLVAQGYAERVAPATFRLAQATRLAA